jgi:hypothetical protein
VCGLRHTTLQRIDLPCRFSLDCDPPPMAGSFFEKAGAISHSGTSAKARDCIHRAGAPRGEQQARDLYLFRGVMVGRVLMFD